MHKIRHHEEDIHDITWAPPGSGVGKVFRDDDEGTAGNSEDASNDDDDDRALFAASGRDRQGRYSMLP